MSTTLKVSAALLLTLLLLIAKILKKSRSKLPPGPPKLPLIGNMTQFFTPMPHHTLGDLAKKYGPVMHLKLGQIGVIVVSSTDVCREIVKDHDLIFSNRPKVLSAEILGYNYTDIGYAPYGAYWRQLRKICTLELLSNTRVQSFGPVRKEEVSLLMSSIASKSHSPVNLTQLFFSLGHDVTSRIAFGGRNPDPMRFRRVLKEGVAVAGGFDVGDFFPSLVFVRAFSGMKSRIQAAFREFDDILSDIIERHENNQNDNDAHEDLVDILLRVKRNGDLEMPLTNDNIKAVILDMFIGGSETVSISLEWAMLEMIRNPRVMEKAQDEIKRIMNGRLKIEESDVHRIEYLKFVISETLRLHPPLPLLIPRETTKRCIVGGYEIPAKTRVIINNWAISRDSSYWDNPEKFYPERFLEKEIDIKGQKSCEFLPFGAGRRACPGISFGMATMELVLVSLLHYFDWQLPVGVTAQNLDMSESFGVTVTRNSNLYLVPVPRFPMQHYIYQSATESK